jgi:hypothetical protein
MFTCGRAELPSAAERHCMLKVLIAEDDLLIAGMAEEVLVEGGFVVCGIARTVRRRGLARPASQA